MDALLKVGTQAVVGEDVDFTLKQCFQVLAELNKIKQAAAFFHVHQEVHVTPLPCLSPRHGPEDPDVVGSVFLREAEYFRPFEFE